MKSLKWVLWVAFIAAALGAAICFVLTFRKEIADFIGIVKDRLNEKKSLLDPDWEEREFGE